MFTESHEPVLIDDGNFFFKATPHEEGGRRYLYCEPSNENWDSQRERIMQKALADSADHFLKFGNLDIEHLTMIGPKQGLTPAESALYEIGVPVEVIKSPKLVVKGEVYQGSGKAAEQANYFWSTMEMTPRKRWYPSVGGKYLPGGRDCQPDGSCVVKGVLWVNIGFAREPVNRTVKAASLTADEFFKAVTAGYGTDSATMTGGRATHLQSHGGGLAKQTVDFDGKAKRYLNRIIGTDDCCPHSAGPFGADMVKAHFEECERLPPTAAGEYARRFLGGIDRAVKRQRAHSA